MSESGSTAFVSHPDCARHDTGWVHPDHQGRLPALVRAVYRDMLQLHGHLLEVEGVPATEEQLLRVHDAEYLNTLRRMAEQAARAGEAATLNGQAVVSGASWDAVRAAAGVAITGVDVVMGGGARNAFCAARPPGHAAGSHGPGGFSLVNNVAVAVRHLLARHGETPALVVEWAGTPTSRTAELLAGQGSVFVLTVGAVETGARPSAGSRGIRLPDGSNGGFFGAAMGAALDDVLATFRPRVFLLGLGLDVLATDPVGRLGVEPADVWALTRAIVERAEAVCGGRLVSVLEGGYDPPALGRATVQHLRALAGLPSA
jgi:acetoin utilization deacetylase AcuC-like enzyme